MNGMQTAEGGTEKAEGGRQKAERFSIFYNSLFEICHLSFSNGRILA